MPAFLKDLRRLSKGNFKHDKQQSAAQSNGHQSSNQSSSTLNTGLDSTSPPSLPSDESSSSSAVPPVPPRPAVNPSRNARYSWVGSSNPTITSTNSSAPPRSIPPTSLYAPKVLSINDGSWVHQKVLLIHGQIADPAQQPLDGQVWVVHHQDSFPATSWPASDSFFKALVHLQPGPNRLRLDFVGPKLPALNNGASTHSSWITINYLPIVSSPPLDLVILLGSDSPGTYDAAPERINREGNGLETAIKKYKMTAYLWQAFTGEQMQRNSFGRRCFRLEEEWQPGTLSSRDADSGQMRNEAKIHIVRTSKTVAELRDAEVAQQNPKASRSGELYAVAMDAVRNYFRMKAGQTRYVSVLLLDTHWDSASNLIRGHAAVGGGDEGAGLKLAVCGSHALQSYPSCMEDVAPAFQDCTRTDTNYVANDSNESGSNWEAANIGIGAHMHETGHAFGCPHQEYGVMKRDYVRLNRTFVCREPYSTRNKSPGQRLCLPKDECVWHRLDCLRFRFHPCFRLPADMPLNSDGSVQVWGIDTGTALITAMSGVTFIELSAEGDEVCPAHIEYLDGTGTNGLPKQLTLTESELQARLPGKAKKNLKVQIHSANQGTAVIENFGQVGAKQNRVKLPDNRIGMRCNKVGRSETNGSRPEEILFWFATGLPKLLTRVRVNHGMAVDGLEFFYEDNSTQLFGKKGGKSGGDEFTLDVRRGESITGFYVRGGWWIDGIQILTSLGRKSEIYGNSSGGQGYTLIPPRGYRIAGISGSCGDWVDGLGVIITR